MRFRFVMPRLRCLLPLLLLLVACSDTPPEKELWIYTSIYQEVYPNFEPGLREAFPTVTFRWFQSGSEKIAAKVLAEQKGGGSKADVLMTSDLFFYQELKKLDLLMRLDGPNIKALPAAFRDPDNRFAINRFPLMVLAYNNELIAEEKAPRSFLDLIDERFTGKLTMPSPLESGSALTAVLYLHQRFGKSYFEGLRSVDVLAAGGNGATLSRIQSGERPVGMVLLENVLKAEASGLEAVTWVVPAEGALPIPAPLGVLKHSDQPELAKQVLDWFFSAAARQVVVAGWVHSTFASDPAPEGAPAWRNIKRHPWDLATFARWSEERQAVKTFFQQIVLQ